MKIFKAVCATMLLSLSLSISTYAEDGEGEVHTPGRHCPVIVADPKAGDRATAEAGDVAFSVVADIMWALVSIF